MVKNKPLSPEDLETARQRVANSEPYSDEVRREFILQWLRQDNLPKEIKSLFSTDLAPSGWVISHLVPLVSRKMALQLRDKEGEAKWLGNIGLVHINLDDYTTSLEYLTRSLQISEDKLLNKFEFDKALERTISPHYVLAMSMGFETDWTVS